MEKKKADSAGPSGRAIRKAKENLAPGTTTHLASDVRRAIQTAESTKPSKRIEALNAVLAGDPSSIIPM